MNRSMSRGKFIFTCVWLGIFAVVFLFWAFYLGEFSKKLAAYETARPQYVAQRVFDEKFLNAAAADIAEYGGHLVSDYEKDAVAADAVSDVISGKELTYASDGNSYSVYADGVKFASFELIPVADAKPVFGVIPVELGKIELYIAPEVEIIVFAPKNAVVKVNGRAVDDTCRVGDYIALPGIATSDPDVGLMAYYRISGLYELPTVTVESTDGGAKFGLDFDESALTYSAEKSYRTYLSITE